MSFLSYTLLTICGISAGFVTAAAYVAFIAMLGVFPKVAAKTKTAGQCILYENCLILGILIATLLQFFVTTPTEGSRNWNSDPHSAWTIWRYLYRIPDRRSV